jgi:uncharacterized protein YdhG (YjbR/CyaY superfamily)
MAKTDFQSVDQYLATQPEAAQAVLGEVRRIIRRTLPEAAEVISYQIPAYKLPGGTALFFAGWKEHYSLYPASDQLIAALGDELAPHRVSKGTLRFPLAEPVPASLIERIAKLRAEEVAEHARAKAASKKKR